MKRENKAILIIGLVGLICFLLLSWLLSTVEDQYHKEENIVKSKIGTKVIYQKDTLFIIDYSLINGTYTLSNNQKVAIDFVNKLKTVK